jgi:hypothetical protein
VYLLQPAEKNFCRFLPAVLALFVPSAAASTAAEAGMDLLQVLVVVGNFLFFLFHAHLLFPLYFIFVSFFSLFWFSHFFLTCFC